MTTNLQLRITESKKTKTKQTTRTGTESQKQRSHRWLSAASGIGRMGGRAQGLRSIIGRYKIDREMLRILQEMEKPKNLYV